MNKITLFFVLFICTASLFLSIVKFGSVPQCFNADEAAYGYNTYSVLKTGKDEYGVRLPVQFKSFGEYKLPLYAYGSLPFVATMGLTESAIRMLNVVMSFFLPFVVFLFARAVFKKNNIALLSSFLVATSLPLHIASRQVYETYTATVLICVASYFFVRLLEEKKTILNTAFIASLGAAFLSYRSSRLFGFFFLLLSSFYALRKKINVLFVALLFLLICIFAVSDIVYKSTRFSNLAFWNNAGFTLKINELRGQNGNRFLYNKVTVGAAVFASRYISHISPTYLTYSGDANARFGFLGMAPITILEYVFMFVGIYYLFRKKQKYRFFLLGLLVISPLSSSLTWLEPSTMRALFFFIPALILAGYGMMCLTEKIKFQVRPNILLLIILIINGIFLYKSWNFYLTDYVKQSTVVNAWECGYKEVATYVKQNYNRFDRFYITRTNGQSYIFMLFYLAYPPEKYQPQASLTGPDEYGFGQVERFDKFVFSFPEKQVKKNEVVIGAPKDFDNKKFDTKKIKKISVNGVERFWIYEP